MEYTVTYSVSISHDGTTIYARLYKKGTKDSIALFSNAVDEPSWLSKKILKETMESRILDAKENIVGEINQFIKRSKIKADKEKAYTEILYQEETVGFTSLYEPVIRREIGFKDDRPAVLPPQ